MHVQEMYGYDEVDTVDGDDIIHICIKILTHPLIIKLGDTLPLP